MIQLFHKGLGRLFLAKRDVDQHPVTSLALLAIYEANHFHGTIRIYEYRSFDGPVHFFTYGLQPAVVLKKLHDRPGFKAMFMLEGMLNIIPDSGERMFLPEGHLCIFRAEEYLVELKEKARIKYWVFDLDPISERLDLKVPVEGRYNITLPMQAHLAEINQPPLLLDEPEKWLSTKFGKILNQLQEVIESPTHQPNNIYLTPDYALKAEMHIRQNLTRSITVKEIARAVGRNDCSLKKEFKKTFLTTMAVMQRRVKIEESMKLLRYTNKSINEIAIECGFDAVRTFRDNFFKVTGHSPSEWRKQFRYEYA